MEATVPPMSAPLCLVHNEDCRLSLNPAALAVLRSVTQPVVVVAVVGLFSTGKSFLTKRMAQNCTGSPLGNAVQKKTKGIWMWCLPHPCKPGVTLVLLDTEGLRNPYKEDDRNNAWIFTLALLLSSTLVYNSMRTDSRTMLGSLCLLTDLRNYVRVRAQADGTDPADEFVRVFPDFVWVVRDFRLQEGERSISADEYLDKILRPLFGFILHGNSKVQHCLRDFFPHHKMFMLERPVAGKDVAQLEMLREDQLQPRFRQQEEAFCQHIWKEAPVKMLLNSSPVTGRMLACLVETYMEAISNGSVPCVESVHMVVVEAENNAVVETAAAEYRRGMEQDLVLPTASLNALMAVHQNWKKNAITFFLSQAFDKTEQLYQALLMDKLEVAKEEFCWRNEKASEQRCCEVLKELWGDMELRMQRGDYVVPGGMRLFQKDLKRMQEEYKRRPNKGVKAEEVLEKFLREKGLEMTETWIDRVDQQCKAVLAEATAATQAVEKQLQQQQVMLAEVIAAKKAVEKQLQEQQQHHQQQQVMLAEVTAVKKAVEKQLEEQQQQQKMMLAEVTAAKKAMEKQLKEQQQQQQKVMLAEVSAAKKAMEKQLQEQQQQQQQVMLAEVTAAKKAMEKQLQEQQQQQKVMLAEVTAAKKAMEKQLQEQQQQQQKVMLAEVTAVKKAMEKQLQEQQQQQQVMLAEVTAAKKAVEKQLQEQQQQQVMLAEVSAAKKAVEKQLEEQQQQVMLAEVSAAKKAVEKQLKEQQQHQQQQQAMLAEVTAAKKVVKKQLEEQQQQQQVTLAKVTAAQEAAEARLEERQQQVMLAEVTVVMKVVERQLEERWQQWTQQLQEEQSLVLSQRLEELEVRLQEGHGREAAALQQVEQEQEEEQTVPSWRSTLLKFLDKVVLPILIRVVSSIVNNGA